MEKSFAFNSDLVDGKYDREYDVTELLEYFADLFSYGISPFVANNLQVIANDDMTVTVRPGVLWDKNGCKYKNTEDLVVSISPADGIRDRIDRISITWQNEERTMKCTIQEGKYDYSPVAPECRRNANYRDYVVADVLVEAGVVKITQAAITDQRLNSDVCGMAAGLLQQIDTKEIFVQFKAWFDETTTEEKQKFIEMVNEFSTWRDSFIENQSNTFGTMKTEFEESIQNMKDIWELDVHEWFENLKEQLTDNVAVNLQNQIGDLSNLQTEDKTSLTAAVNEVKEKSATASKIDNMSIQRDIQERLSVPALKRVFRGEIKINSSSSATLYIPLKADVSNMETGDDWIQEGDLFFCDVNPDGANYNCQPTTFSVIGSNEVSNTAGLYTTNYITGSHSQKDDYSTTPYITHRASSSENNYDNKKGFTILRYRGIHSGKMNFQDLLNGYTNHTTSARSNTTMLATGSAVYIAYYNAMFEHKFASFFSIGTSGETISLDYGCQYLMVLVAYNASTGAIYGTTARLITTPGVAGSTANVNILSLGATSNTGYAITAGNYKVTVKSSSASYEVTGFLYKVLED